ncbi:hypothetical protein [Treponema bryantii]|uniref:hypothetical protein n=1 Tax=Treponema bryantii TaxID=163 RepID=UPI00041DAE0C|nr:hypothetical protein [Treponema bryantii]
MKKITLMLCACAMAFAGLLVSCNNGSEYINASGVSYDYKYKVTGTIKEATASGAVAAPSKTSDVYTFTKAVGKVNWWESENSYGDVPTYWIEASGYADEVYTNSSSVETKYYKEDISLPFYYLEKFEDGFYINLQNLNANNYVYQQNQKGKYAKVTLDGDFGDDEFTLTYEYTLETGTNNETTVNTKTYSGTVKFSSVAE